MTQIILHKVRVRLRGAILQGIGGSRLMAAKKPKKKQSIRNSEYYNTQKCFDQLYQDSLHGKRFTQLMDIITSEENIMLA